jgi:dipeptidase
MPVALDIGRSHAGDGGGGGGRRHHKRLPPRRRQAGRPAGRAAADDARATMAPRMLRLLAAAAAAVVPASLACTAIVFARGAVEDGAAYTTSTADCLDCDFRLARVPAAVHGKGVGRKVYEYKANYPHVVREDRGAVWASANLQGTAEQVRAWAKGRGGVAIGEVPEVPKTFALLESGAGYALLNERGVGVGESTCIAVFASRPVSGGGKAMLDVSELSRIALERCGTAREAVEMMGALAEQFGYYGAEWDGEYRFDEAGENLMVSDPEESWVFHVLPDDTGASAIWAAQRVPDGEVAVVANQFLIRTVDPADSANVLASTNLKPIAVKHGLHDDARDGPHVDFAKVYGDVRPHSSYTTHRVYRVLTMVNPDLVGALDPYPSALMDGYPFSVKPKARLSVGDLFRIQRDHYEGTPWDMTTSAAAQPFGDPARFDTGPLGNFTTHQIAAAGEFGRAISIGRTSYAAVVRSTRELPQAVGAMLYFAPQQPDSSVFVPVYVAAESLPRELTVGSLFRFHDDSLFWAVTAVSNWVHHFYRFAVKDLRPAQADFERAFAVGETDAAAAKLVKAGRTDDAAQLMADFTARAAASAHAAYTKLFKRLIARFHDGFTMEDESAADVKMTTMFYSLDWLSRAGYYSMGETGGGDAATAPLGVVRKTPGHAVVLSSAERDLRSPDSVPRARVDAAYDSSSPAREPVVMPRAPSVGVFVSGLAAGVAATLAAVYGAGLVKQQSRRSGYAEIC